MIDSTFIMPNSPESERAILGSILLHNKESELAFEKLNEESFYNKDQIRKL